jgi:hypothetical protein
LQKSRHFPPQLHYNLNCFAAEKTFSVLRSPSRIEENPQIMLANSCYLLQRTANQEVISEVRTETCDGMEVALFRAREALLAGWHLTPEEAMNLVGPKAWHGDSLTPSLQNLAGEREDEIEDIPLYFGDR